MDDSLDLEKVATLDEWMWVLLQLGKLDVDTLLDYLVCRAELYAVVKRAVAQAQQPAAEGITSTTKIP